MIYNKLYLNMETNVQDVLNNIVRIRTSKGFSQDYIAEKIGLKQAGYHLIEKGERGLSVEKLLQIAIVLECDISVFFKKNTDNNVEKTEISIVSELVEKYGLEKKELIDSLKSNVESLKLNVQLLKEKLKKYEAIN